MDDLEDLHLLVAGSVDNGTSYYYDPDSSSYTDNGQGQGQVEGKEEGYFNERMQRKEKKKKKNQRRMKMERKMEAMRDKQQEQQSQVGEGIGNAMGINIRSELESELESKLDNDPVMGQTRLGTDNDSMPQLRMHGKHHHHRHPHQQPTYIYGGTTLSKDDSSNKGLNNRDCMIEEDDAESTMETGRPDPEDNIPGTAKLYLKVFGCSHNISDHEYMTGALSEYGYEFCDKEEDADLMLITSCTVKGPSEDAFVNFVKSGRKANKPMVLAGCVPQADRGLISKLLGDDDENMKEEEEEEEKGEALNTTDRSNAEENIDEEQALHTKEGGTGEAEVNRKGKGTGKGKGKGKHAAVSIVGTSQIDRIVFVVSETLNGNSVRLLGKNRTLPRLNLPKVRKNKLVEIIPINSGCLGRCTYCKTVHARGRLGSYSPFAIVERVRDVIAEGQVKEIWLTSEDTGAYGIDLGTSIATLLRLLQEEVKGSAVMLRLGMSNPPYMKHHLDAIADFLNSPNVFSFLHLPVQSGSDKVLQEMKRDYEIGEFCHVVDYLRSKVPHLNIMTDIIVGFPTENEEEFQQTLKLVQRYEFPYLNISKFFPRPGTPAMRMEQLDTSVKKERSKRLTELFLTQKPLDKLLFTNKYVQLKEGTMGIVSSWIQKLLFQLRFPKIEYVWISNETSKSGHLVAHTKGYIQCLLMNLQDRRGVSFLLSEPKLSQRRGLSADFRELHGQKVLVKLDQASKFHVQATVLFRLTALHRKLQELNSAKTKGNLVTTSSWSLVFGNWLQKHGGGAWLSKSTPHLRYFNSPFSSFAAAPTTAVAVSAVVAILVLILCGTSLLSSTPTSLLVLN